METYIWILWTWDYEYLHNHCYEYEYAWENWYDFIYREYECEFEMNQHFCGNQHEN